MRSLFGEERIGYFYAHPKQYRLPKTVKSEKRMKKKGRLIFRIISSVKEEVE
jgi:hypothetical protein